MKVLSVLASETHQFLLKKHYAHRIPCITNAFGLYDERELVGVCCFGVPPSPSLCIGICGEKYASIVRELNRLCINDDYAKNNYNIASRFVSACLRRMYGYIIVSYADTSMGHVGTIYKATNFLYTGLSAPRTEWRERKSNKHSKTISETYSLEERLGNPNRFEVVERPQKHRYIYFSGSKTMKKEWRKELKYPILPYPIGTSKRYDASAKIITQDILF